MCYSSVCECLCCLCKKIKWLEIKINSIQPTPPSPVPVAVKYAHVQEQYPHGTEGKESLSDLARSRTFNTIIYSDIPGFRMEGDNIYLPPGTYEIFVRAPSFHAGGNNIRLHSFATGKTLLQGGNAFSNLDQTDATVFGIISSEEEIQFYVLHYTNSNTGNLGRPVNMVFPADAPEIYAEMFIKKIA